MRAKLHSAPPEQRLLVELARLKGIQPSYLDMAGQSRSASAETLRGLLTLWHVEAANRRQVEQAIRLHHQQHWGQPLEPVVVLWQGRVGSVQVRLPAGLKASQLSCQLHLEDGPIQSLKWAPRPSPLRARARVEGQDCLAQQLSLPALPLGYHELRLEWRGRVHRALLIGAPTQSYSPAGEARRWGVFLPLYALHSRHSWGAGNLSDWQRLAQWVDSLGGAALATLPLLASFLGESLCEPSPYSPASRLFWNEFYVDICRAPEFAACPAAQRLVKSAAFRKRLEAFRQAPLVDYRAQMAARRQVLEPMARFFFGAGSGRRSRQFERFLKERPALADYAQFRAASEQSASSWQDWQPRLRHGKLQAGDFSPAARDYHLYAQWLAQEQMTLLMQSFQRRGLQFCLDLPLGVHPDSYDLWRQPDAFAFPASAGAPPDPCFTRGQDWGFAPLHPQRLRLQRYGYLLEYLRFQMRHTGLLRVDHVMGLHRLYWIPPGAPASQGAYVDYPAEELYAILCLESHRHQTVLVGENLGTVPPEVNRAMARHELRQTYVVQYEQRPEPRRALRVAPRLSVATLNTHDMPTWRAHCLGLDILDRADLGLVPAQKIASQQAQRRALTAALASFLKRKGLRGFAEEEPQALLSAALEWLSLGPAELVLVNLEDLWQEERPQNVPGTCAERANWQRKAQWSLEQIVRSRSLRALLRKLGGLRWQETGKGSRGGAEARRNELLKNAA